MVTIKPKRTLELKTETRILVGRAGGVALGLVVISWVFMWAVTFKPSSRAGTGLRSKLSTSKLDFTSLSSCTQIRSHGTHPAFPQLSMSNTQKSACVRRTENWRRSDNEHCGEGDPWRLFLHKASWRFVHRPGCTQHGAFQLRKAVQKANAQTREHLFVTQMFKGLFSISPNHKVNHSAPGAIICKPKE